ncbi:Glycosyltransferase involved in cell wall bisynthesis [Kaistella treverensis]|uniref:Glycosyltransferase involved in cell wall bisynthesis n=1 Tax=Kaistella treverensis TaxID=631455 RepID=A0A1I3NJA6_9FLAO|nr:glycosyltransferase family A protein [Kaistella treverensis]SFJ09259.1 Glycosyltransferase involved in cell wall bisynthesis [Kaistella treverensis]
MFSVIIPYYKKRKYIERCLDSVLNQTFKNFEIILIDDGSNDDIALLIDQKYPEVNLIKQQNQGVSVARNAGIAIAKMSYVVFLDADDAWNPLFLQFAHEVIEKHKNLKIIGAHYSRNREILEKVYNYNDYIEVNNYFQIAIKNILFATGATIINKSFFDTNHGFNPILKRGQDVDVWIRTIESGGEVFYIKNTMMYYSDEDPNQASGKIGKVENGFVGVVNELYKPIIEKNINSDFSKFISKFVYLNLYPYYFSPENHAKAQLSLKQNSHYYFFLHLPYYLPLHIGHRIVSNRRSSKLMRLWLKFFLRKIYNKSFLD